MEATERVGSVGTALRGRGRGRSEKASLPLLDLVWHGGIKVLALTTAIVTAVVALFVLAEAGRVAARSESLQPALVFLAQGVGLTLATALLLSSSLKASVGRFALATLAAGALVLL